MTSSVSETLIRHSSDPASKSDAVVVLPPRHGAIVGRLADIEAVELSFAKGNRGRRMLVHGVPGVGKTTFALEVAHRVAKKGQHDLVLWLDFQDVTMDRGISIPKSATALRDLGDVLRELALVLREPAALQASKREALQIVTSRLAERRSLLILDNLDTLKDGEVAQFALQLPDLVDVVATARDDLHWPENFPLLPLGPDSTEELARLIFDQRKIPYSKETLEAVVRLSGGAPLTVIWLSTLLDQGYSASEIEVELRKPNSSLSSYYFSKQFERVFAKEELSRVAALIAVAQSIRREDVWRTLKSGQEVTSTRGAISSLEDMKLVNRDEMSLSMLPLVRENLLARFSAMPKLQSEVGGLWIGNLDERTLAAIAHETWREAITEIDTYRLELVSGLRWINSNDRPETIARGIHLLSNSAYYLFAGGLWDVLLEAADWAVPHAANTNDLGAVLEIGLTWAVRIHRHREGLGSALRHFDRWENFIERDRKFGDPVLLAKLRVAKASLRRRDMPTPSLAGDLAQDAEMLVQNREVEWACRAMLRAGNILSEGKALSEAQKAFQWTGARAATIPSRARSSEISAIALANQGILANRAGEFAKAIPLLASAIPNQVQIYEEATSHGELARAFDGVRQYEQAQYHARKCLQFARSLGLSTSVMESEPGWDLSRGRELSEALSHVSVAERIRRFLFHSAR